MVILFMYYREETALTHVACCPCHARPLQYPKASLAEISEALKPYSALSLEQFAREEIKQKVRGSGGGAS